MCNCGNKRSTITTQTSGMPAGKQPVTIPTHKTGPDIGFVYTGQSALSVTGTVTGKRYRFHGPQDQQLVDFRDASAMMLVPVLQRIQ